MWTFEYNILIQVIIIIISIIAFYYTFKYTKQAAKDTENHAKLMWCLKNQDLLHKIKSNIDETDAQCRFFHKQIDLLISIVGKNIEDAGVVEEEEKSQFSRNLKIIDNLLQECDDLTKSVLKLKDLTCEGEYPETFYENLLIEYENTQKILEICKQIRSLLDENITIAEPLFKERVK